MPFKWWYPFKWPSQVVNQKIGFKRKASSVCCMTQSCNDWMSIKWVYKLKTWRMSFIWVPRPHLGDICPSETHLPMLRAVVVFSQSSSAHSAQTSKPSSVYYIYFDMCDCPCVRVDFRKVCKCVCVSKPTPPTPPAPHPPKKTLFKPNQTLVGLWASSISNTLISYSAPYLCLLPPPAPN